MDPKTEYELHHLNGVLVALRAAHWSHWTAHWKVRGETFYGDHLLFQRLYESVETEIDTLGEKIVGLYGSDAIENASQLELANDFLRDNWVLAGKVGTDNLYVRALQVEDNLQFALKTTYDNLKTKGGLTLGMDDFLMATANAHESNQYLLKQRLSQSTPSAARVAAEFTAGYGGDPYWVNAKFPGKDRDGKPFAKGEKVFYYPKTKTFLTGEKAEKASREFESARDDENY